MQKWVKCENCEWEIALELDVDAMTIEENDDNIEVSGEHECENCGHEIHATLYFALTGYVFEGADA